MAVTSPTVDIRGKRVLDLACGGGNYARKFLSWGAASVTGMDVSTGMLDTARRSAAAQGIPGSRLKFVHGDATDEDLLIEGAPFDIVTGCWLLNYAPDAATMTRMYRFIARNLRAGGHWVGLTTPPLLSDGTHEADLLNVAMAPLGAWGRHGQGGRVLKAMPDGDGYFIRAELGTDAHTVKAGFDCYSLSLRVYQQAWQDAGMFESMEIQDFVLPGLVKNAYAKGHWNDLTLQPSCRIITARKLS
ncbi:unnamed protein product [Discula destructiva]